MDDDYKSTFSALIEGKTTDATKQTGQSSSTSQVNN